MTKRKTAEAATEPDDATRDTAVPDAPVEQPGAEAKATRMQLSTLFQLLAQHGITGPSAQLSLTDKHGEFGQLVRFRVVGPDGSELARESPLLEGALRYDAAKDLLDFAAAFGTSVTSGVEA